MNNEHYVLERVDGLIKRHQFSNNQTVPKGVKMNFENATELIESIRTINKLEKQIQITHLRGTEIIIDDTLGHDEFIFIS